MDIGMKKLTLLLGAAFLIGTASYACDGGGKCCKGKKEACASEKKTACEKGKGCCKKETASNKDAKPQSTKETKTTATKKS